MDREVHHDEVPHGIGERFGLTLRDAMVPQVSGERQTSNTSAMANSLHGWSRRAGSCLVAQSHDHAESGDCGRQHDAEPDREPET
jgi:hypothetical protein